MAGDRKKINDHARRKASITKLAAKIGMALCRSTYQHLDEAEWARLDALRVELGALRAEAGL